MKQPPLFFQRRFLPLWTSLSLGAFTDNMLKQALGVGISYGAIHLAFLKNPDDALPLAGALFPVSLAVLSSLAGQIADKYEKSALFRLYKLIEVGLMAAAAVGFLTGNGLLLALTLFLMGAQSAFFSPARIASMPQYLHTDELVRGNAFFGGGLYVSILLGIIAGGGLVTLAGGPAQVSGVLIVAALGGWLASRAIPEAEADDPSLRIQFNPIPETARIIRFALEAGGVSRPLFGTAWFFLIATAVTVAVPLYARDVLNAGAVVATSLMGLFAIGTAAGAIALGSLARGRSALGVSAAGAAGASLCALAIVLLGPLSAYPGESLATPAQFFANPAALAIAAVFFFSAAFMGAYIVPLQAAVQRRAPAQRRARIMAAGNIMNAIAAIAGSLSVLGVTRTSATPSAVFAALFVGQACVVAYMFYRWRRSGTASPGSPDPEG